jgi:hypothetical protein
VNGARPEAQQRAAVDLGAVPGQPVRPRREQQPEPALPASGCGEPLAGLAGSHNRPWQRGWMGAGRAAFAEQDAGHRSPRRVRRHRAAGTASECRRSGERHADDACGMPHVRLDVRPGDVVAPSRPGCRTADGVRLAKAPRTRGRAQFIRKAAGDSACQCGYSATRGITPGPAILCTADILNPLSTTCAYSAIRRWRPREPVAVYVTLCDRRSPAPDAPYPPICARGGDPIDRLLRAIAIVLFVRMPLHG